jgi:hypothetical protein
MAKRLREVIEASNPLSRKRTADLIKKLRSLTKASRMLKAKIGAAAENDEKSHRMRVHPERRKSRDS